MGRKSVASTIWDMAATKLPKSSKIATSVEIDYVLNHLKSHHPDLYTGFPLPQKSDQEVVQLAREISFNATEPSLQVRFNFLATGLEIGNMNYGWNVPLVPQLVRIKKPTNWATPDRFEKRALAKKLEEAFGRDLERPLPKDPVVQIGQIIFTAVFFGCLLERKWLEPFLTAITQRNFFQYKSVLWIEMVQEVKRSGYGDDGKKSEITFFTKRFFPDNYTAAFLYRALDQDLLPSETSKLNPWACLQAYLKNLSGLANSELPQNLDVFLKVSVSRNLFLPGSMLAYATGQIKSTSLAIGPCLRCIT